MCFRFPRHKYMEKCSAAMSHWDKTSLINGTLQVWSRVVRTSTWHREMMGQSRGRGVYGGHCLHLKLCLHQEYMVAAKRLWAVYIFITKGTVMIQIFDFGHLPLGMLPMRALSQSDLGHVSCHLGKYPKLSWRFHHPSYDSSEDVKEYTVEAT